MRNSIKIETSKGLRLVAAVLLTLLTAGLLLWGAGAVFSKLPGPKWGGGAALAAAGVVLVFTVQRWTKIVPGLLALATFNAVVTAASGHILNNPSARIARPMAVLASALLALSCALSLHFYDRRLNVVDRAALLLLVACLVWGMLTSFTIVPLGIAASGLAFGWAYDLIQRRRGFDGDSSRSDHVMV